MPGFDPLIRFRLVFVAFKKLMPLIGTNMDSLHILNGPAMQGGIIDP